MGRGVGEGLLGPVPVKINKFGKLSHCFKSTRCIIVTVHDRYNGMERVHVCCSWWRNDL